MKDELYVKYDVEIQIRDKIVGGIPKNPEVIEGWIRGKIAKGELKMAQEEAKELAEKTAEEVNADEEIEKSWTGFKQNDTGLYIEERQIKAMMKECASTLGLNQKHKGLKQVLQHGLFIKPERIHPPQQTPDGYEESVVHTWRGSALKRTDYISRPQLSFQIWVVDTGKCPEAILRQIFELAQENGLGANRSQGHGKFDITKFEKVEA